MPANLRARLREATSDLHQAAETAMGRRGAIETPAGRAHFLGVMGRAHLAHHAALDRASDLVGLPRRSRALLEALALPFDPASDSSVPGDAVCMGTAYVFEGSALGASFLVKRHRQAQVDVPPYLTLLSEDASHRWPVLIRRLEGYQDEADVVVASARSAFAWIIEAANAR